MNSLFELIEDQDQSCGGLHRRGVGLHEMAGGLGQGPFDQVRRRLGIGTQHEGQLLDRGTVAGKLGQGLIPPQGRRQAVEQIARAFAWPQDGPSPEADPFHHAGLHKVRQDAGPHQRGLAATADAQNQEKGATLGRLPLQAFQDLADRPRAAEENGVVLELEDLQPAEGTALGPGRPARPPRDLRGRCRDFCNCDWISLRR